MYRHHGHCAHHNLSLHNAEAFWAGKIGRINQQHLDQLFRRYNDIIKAKAYFVYIDQYIDEILMQKSRTGYGARKLVNAFEELSAIGVNRLTHLLAGRPQRTYLSDIEKILNAYRQLPDAATPISEELKRKAVQKGRGVYVAISSEKMDELKDYRQSGLLPDNIYKIVDRKPEYPTSSVIRSWIWGKVQTADQDQVHLVLQLCRKIGPQEVVVENGEGKDQALLNRGDYKAIPPDKKAELVHYRDLKLLPSKIYKFIPYNPEYPRPHVISNWINGNVKTASVEEVDRVLELCREVEEKERLDQKKEKLDQVVTRGGKPLPKERSQRSKNLREIKEDFSQSHKKKKACSKKPSSRRNGKVSITPPLEPVKPEIWMSITPEMSASLSAQLNRVDLGVKDMMAAAGLSSVSVSKVKQWMTQKTQTVNEEIFEKVLNAWKQIPTPDFILVDREFLLTHREAIDALEAEKAFPLGLTHQKICRWQTGKIRTARSDHWEFVVKKLNA